MAVADGAQYGEQSLEEGPVTPHSRDRVQILSRRVRVISFKFSDVPTTENEKTARIVSGLIPVNSEDSEDSEESRARARRGGHSFFFLASFLAPFAYPLPLTPLGERKDGFKNGDARARNNACARTPRREKNTYGTSTGV
jgi:hypothetical protein